jgi:hypothetical protein
MPKWEEMTVDEKLESLLRDKANRQDLLTIVTMIEGVGDAVVKLQKEISELLQKLTVPPAPEA